ncbi:hypothetical protein [Corynebacterium wankanglinii]|uniref:Phage protein n=1 Tax=Corynebacterium wankanglinii TaxID=2735136 RepID=A0A838CF41_9CORY|nr:hypothetical protein [Corynebacterium wankanglinii]MBA1834166.1 hypothetical protein [Corynebacterium wankanglinii]
MALEKFHYTTSDGTKIDVHYAKDILKRKQIRKINEEAANPADAEEAMVKAAFDKKTYDIIDNLSIRDYEAFMLGWMEEGNPNVGES